MLMSVCACQCWVCCLVLHGQYIWASKCPCAVRHKAHRPRQLSFISLPGQQSSMDRWARPWNMFGCNVRRETKEGLAVIVCLVLPLVLELRHSNSVS